MGFDKQAWLKTQFQPRTAEVELPAFQQWHGEDEKCVFVVKGLTGNELAKTLEASSKVKSLETVIQAIGNSRQQIDDLREAIGLGDNTPAEIVKRLEQLVAGAVEPAFELNEAVTLAERHPVEFYQLTNEITRLTGLGMDVKK